MVFSWKASVGCSFCFILFYCFNPLWWKSDWTVPPKGIEILAKVKMPSGLLFQWKQIILSSLSLWAQVLHFSIEALWNINFHKGLFFKLIHMYRSKLYCGTPDLYGCTRKLTFWWYWKIIYADIPHRTDYYWLWAIARPQESMSCTAVTTEAQGNYLLLGSPGYKAILK